MTSAPSPRQEEMMGEAPVLDLDPFADDFLREPDVHHEQLREAGPVVFLERYGVWAMARFAEVRAALRDHETFCSSAGVGLSDFRKETPWRPPSLLLEADPPQHTRTRRATANVMSPRAIARFRADFEHEAEVMVTGLVARGSFDGVTALAQADPLRVFPDAVGLSRDGRENLLAYGSMVFNAFGPRNRLFVEAMAAAEPVRAWIADHCKRKALAPDGLGAHLYQAADAGDITEEEAGMLARSLLSAGIDTSTNALASALHALAARPTSGPRCATTPRWPARCSRRHFAMRHPSRRSSEPQPVMSRWGARRSPTEKRSCCSSALPTATPATGKTQTASTSPGTTSATSVSGRASTPASGRGSLDSKPRSCSIP
jgi:cytochrome P450